MERTFKSLRTVTLILACLTVGARASHAYSVLAHEAIIDSLWDVSIKKILLARYPNSSEEDLRKAHAHAYGGCILQDMGYYPFGSHFFSDLTHYVRSGDFVQSLLREAHDVNELAFALGALAHYAADNNGHRIAVNRAVPMLYPNLRKKFGNSVTYADDKPSHLKTEFAFDVLQVARGRFAPDGYRAFIGFDVSRDLLERALKATYGLETKDVFTSLTLAIGTYRRAVGSIIPGMTKVAWRLKKDEIVKEQPSLTRKAFVYRLSRSSYEKEWGADYQKPGLGARFLAFLLRLVPIGGPFQALSFHTPTPAAEKLFMASFNATSDQYQQSLRAFDKGQVVLPNSNFDVGELTRPGKYKPADDVYAQLTGKLAGHHFAAPPEMLNDITKFYQDPKATYSTKKDKNGWDTLSKQLAELRSIAAKEQ